MREIGTFIKVDQMSWQETLKRSHHYDANLRNPIFSLSNGNLRAIQQENKSSVSFEELSFPKLKHSVNLEHGPVRSPTVREEMIETTKDTLDI